MVDQVKVIEIGADAIEVALTDNPYLAAYPPKLMRAAVAALGRHGFIIEDRYEEEAGPVPPVDPTIQPLPGWVGGDPVPQWPTTAPDWETSGDDA